MKLLAAFFVFVCLVGCASQTSVQPFKKVDVSSNDTGVIYLFFRGEGVTQGWSPTVFGPSLYVNDKDLGVLALGTYVPLVLKAGSHTIKTTSNWNNKAFADLNVSFELKKGESKYIEYFWVGQQIDHNTNKWVSRYVELKETDALRKLNYCKLNSDLDAKSKLL
jgi:hypothetical protein